MDTISEETRQHLLERHREAQHLQEVAREADQGLRSATRVILLEKGLDPETHNINLETGVIQKDETPPTEGESPNEGPPETPS